MKITKTSELSGKAHTLEIPVDEEKYNRWLNDPDSPHIQHVFPELSAEDREFLLTGITAQEWDENFSYL